MVVRIHNTSKWAVLAPGKVLALSGEQYRKVRVEVNCPAPTRFDVVENDVPTFLAVVQGHEVLEFSAGATAYLAPTSDDEVWYFTNDGDSGGAYEDPNAVSFVKMMSGRPTRNPDLERMMFKMEQRMLQRDAAIAAENQAWRARLEAKGIDPDTGEVLENGDAAAAGAAGADAGGDAGAAAGAEAAGAAGGAASGPAA